ncbi:hypothetical protein HII36_53650 [Nonomuraea sp. NN258]|uniref:hypothetical protein n=1 Tax=Nonomuraea antri TaxID=2730852 RepID=UPI00156A1482|nr:hypothetical protein [Nonomuraea antri]NRQ40599.1 hypothetical protein [Nonomuraea antri]
MPFLLLTAAVITPMWVDDHRLDRMIDRIQDHPLPPETDFGYFDPQVEVSGDSGDCWYTIRFELFTERPVHDVLTHYRQANIEDPDGDLGDYEIAAWTPFDASGTRADDPSIPHSVIIDLDGMYDDFWTDLRCW